MNNIQNIQETFLTADKYIQEGHQNIYNNDNSSGLGLCLFEQVNTEFCDDRLNVLEQRIIYEKLHGSYKKALNKALQDSFKLEQFINLLENFAENGNDNFQILQIMMKMNQVIKKIRIHHHYYCCEIQRNDMEKDIL